MTISEVKEFIRQIEENSKTNLVVASNGKKISQKDIDIYEDLLIFYDFLKEHEWSVNKYNALVSETKSGIKRLRERQIRKDKQKSKVSKLPETEPVINEDNLTCAKRFDNALLEENFNSLYNLKKDEIVQDININCTYSLKKESIIQDSTIEPKKGKIRVKKRRKYSCLDDKYFINKLKALTDYDNHLELNNTYSMLNYLIANFRLNYKEKNYEENKEELKDIGNKIVESTLTVEQKRKLSLKLAQIARRLERENSKGRK